MHTTLASILLATLATSLTAQGSVVPFGTGCALQNQTASIGNAGLPSVGNAFSLTYTGPNYTYNSAQQTAQPVLALGVNPVTVTIPAGLLLYQPAGCTGYLDPVALMPMPVAGNQPRYESSYAISVPNSAGLVGYSFLAQWLLVHTQCGFAGCDISALITSDAAVVTVGP